MIGAASITYTSGQAWKDRRQRFYDPLKGPILESYIPTFIKVNVRCILIIILSSKLVCCKVKTIIVVLYCQRIVQCIEVGLKYSIQRYDGFNVLKQSVAVIMSSLKQFSSSSTDPLKCPPCPATKIKLKLHIN